MSKPGENSGIVTSGGSGNVQTSGQTEFDKSEWDVSAPGEGKGNQIRSEGKGLNVSGANTGIVNAGGQGNVQTSGKTNMGSSKWKVGGKK